MKPKIKYTLLFTVILLTINCRAQTDWTKYAGNPVITKGPADWDIIAIGQPTVLYENDTIKMWYPGVGADMKARICYATSTDGIHWTKYSEPVIDVGNAGEWDCGWLDTPEIVKNDDGYKMYYYGDTAQQFAGISSAIGMAFSDDGIHWTKEAGNPIFTKGSIGEWDATWIESPAIIYDNETEEYNMWYNGVDTSTWRINIGLATSSDGIVWTKYEENPVITVSDWGSYDDMWLGTPAVLYENGTYEMWYSGTAASSYNPVTSAFDTISICYAASSDGINWAKSQSNPLFNTFSTPYDSIIDSGGPWAADLIFNPNTDNYMMWYETFEGFSMATAPKIVTETGSLVEEPNELLFTPNPFNLYTTIITDRKFEEGILIIYSASGCVIKTMYNVMGNSIQIDRSGLADGLYLIQLIDRHGTKSGRIVIE
jgi:beta-1,2-mannobiose phosphorylase / 1,2-beta-oligomannan phosphorylase